MKNKILILFLIGIIGMVSVSIFVFSKSLMDQGGLEQPYVGGEITTLPPEQEVKCPDGVCDDYERANPNACPQDCERIGQQTEQIKNITYVYNWTMFGHDASHSGYSSSEAPDDNSILWKYKVTLPQISEMYADKDVHGLVYNSGKLYFGFDKFVYVLDVLSGKELWNTNLDDEVMGLAIVDNKVIVSGGKGIYALSAENGEELWSYYANITVTNTKPHGTTTVTIVNNKIYFGSNDQYLHSLKTDGTFVWKFLTEGSIHSYPAVGDDRVCFASENPDFSVYCLNATTGDKIWHHTFPHEEGIDGMFHAPPAIFNNMVLIGEEGGKRGVRQSGTPITPAPSNFYALDINTGDIIWNYTASDWIVTSAAVAYGKVYFSTWDENFYALNVTNGQLIWKAKGVSTPTVADGKVFVGSSNGVFAYDADNGKLKWSYETKDRADSLIIGDGRLYTGFSSGDVVSNQIIAFG